jgi:hypothetical protein
MDALRPLGGQGQVQVGFARVRRRHPLNIKYLDLELLAPDANSWIS